MEYSKFRDNELSEKNRLNVYQDNNYSACSFDELQKLGQTMQEQKRDFNYLVNNFNVLSDKEFFKYYKTFYKWDNQKLDTLEKSPLLDIFFTARPSFLKDSCIDIMYESCSDAFKKIRSEFTREILEQDYEKYCKAEKDALVRVKDVLKNRQINIESNIL